MTEQYFENYIAYITARIENKSYGNIGTGFFYMAPVPMDDGKDRAKLLLISNKHVLLGAQEKSNPKGILTIKLNRKKADGTPDFGNVRTFDHDEHEPVFTHPDPEVDLACIDVSRITHTDAFLMYLNQDLLKPINYERVAVGRDVIFVGYPANYYDKVNNLPLIRKGTIASMPNVDFNGKGQIVLDAQIFPGSSGSPVFVDWDNKYSLLGVISDMVTRNSELQKLPVNTHQLGVKEALGLGIIIKQRHVQELIDHFVNEIIRIYTSVNAVILQSVFPNS